MKPEHLTWLKDYFKTIYKTPVLENFLGLELVKLGKGKASYFVTGEFHKSDFFRP